MKQLIVLILVICNLALTKNTNAQDSLPPLGKYIVHKGDTLAYFSVPSVRNMKKKADALPYVQRNLDSALKVIHAKDIALTAQIEYGLNLVQQVNKANERADKAIEIADNKEEERKIEAQQRVYWENLAKKNIRRKTLWQVLTGAALVTGATLLIIK